MKAPISLILFVVIVSILKSTLFVVTEGQQAIITQFGKPIGKTITKAGIDYKIPFMQEVRFVDKRILSWDGFPNQIPTKDKKYIKVDTTARWRIVDPLKFIQTVQNERGAKARLDAILDATTRDVISNNNLVEAVRNSNSILEKIEENKKVGIDDDLSGEIDKIDLGRENLSLKIVESADKELSQIGIKLVDVQLRRISYEKSVEDKVYERMISERQKIAQEIRSIGKGEKAKVEGKLAKDLQQINSKSYKQVQEIKGKAEAKAIAIYANAYKKSPKFYEFVRTMESYKKSIGKDSKMILSSDSEFLKFLKSN